MISPVAIVFFLAIAMGPIALVVYLVSMESQWRRWRRRHLGEGRPSLGF